MFARRPDALRKLWLLESRIPALKPVLAHCVKNRLGYTVVEAEDLERLSGSAHHEGVVFGAMPAPEWAAVDLAARAAEWPRARAVARWRRQSAQPRSDPAQRRALRCLRHPVAEGIDAACFRRGGARGRGRRGVRADRAPGPPDNAFDQLKAAGFTIAATVVRGGESLFKAKLPERLVYILGAEQSGVDPRSRRRARCAGHSRPRRGRKPQRRLRRLGADGRVAAPAPRVALTFAARAVGGERPKSTVVSRPVGHHRVGRDLLVERRAVDLSSVSLAVWW
jgi:TrmH RNA methyltransferase